MDIVKFRTIFKQCSGFFYSFINALNKSATGFHRQAKLSSTELLYDINFSLGGRNQAGKFIHAADLFAMW